jgi:hypothetical protein
MEKKNGGGGEEEEVYYVSMQSKMHSMTHAWRDQSPFSGIPYEGKTGLPYVETTFVCDYIVCQFFNKHGTWVLLKKLSSLQEFHENQCLNKYIFVVSCHITC